MQSRLMSFIESIINVAIGFAVAVTAQALVFPLFGIEVSLSTNLMIGVIFTFISIGRSYCVRRLFNWYHLVLNNIRYWDYFTTKDFWGFHWADMKFNSGNPYYSFRIFNLVIRVFPKYDILPEITVNDIDYLLSIDQRNAEEEMDVNEALKLLRKFLLKAE